MNIFQRAAQRDAQMWAASTQAVAHLWRKFRRWWNRKRYGRSPMADVVGMQQNIEAFNEMQMAYLRNSAISYDPKAMLFIEDDLSAMMTRPGIILPALEEEWPEHFEDEL